MTTLPPNIEARVQAIAAGGRYGSENAVLNEALFRAGEAVSASHFHKRCPRTDCSRRRPRTDKERGEGLNGEEVFRELEAELAEIERRCS